MRTHGIETFSDLRQVFNVLYIYNEGFSSMSYLILVGLAEIS